MTSAAALLVAGLDKIAVREQHRVARLLGAHRHGVARHDVGTVDEPGDPPEALGLALSEVAVLRRVQPGKRGVRSRVDATHGLEDELLGDFGDRQALGFERVFTRLQRAAVERDRFHLERLTVEHERRGRAERGGIAAHRQARHNTRVVVEDRDVELDRRNQKSRGRVVLQIYRVRRGVVHGVLPA
jgi:hypothetical protein